MYHLPVTTSASSLFSSGFDGYPTIKGIPTGVPIKSSPFTVGGHRWRICFFRNGDRDDSVGSLSFSPNTSLFLFLDEVVARPVTAQFGFAFMGEERASLFQNEKIARG